MKKKTITNNDVELYRQFQSSPIFFVEKIWGLTPQPTKLEYKALVLKLIDEGRFDDILVEYFEPFIKGKHITWQQWLILKAIENAINNKGKKRISIKSGHGIGKTADLSLLIIWYLFCHKNAQVPCTAPTSEQMHDILWKEISIWLSKMPEELQAKFDWTTGYLRVTESPTTWFARAKTARKEKPEALAGVHGDWVFFIVDEAAGVPIEIFNTAEGALTGENVLVVMISNPTRLIGYFHDSFHSDKEDWQNLSFNAEDSPIVDKKFVDRIIRKHDKDSDEYRIRVQGKFPKADAVDDKGYVPLLMEKWLNVTSNSDFVGIKKLGIDPSGEGADESSWVMRDSFRTQVIMKEKKSDPKSIASSTLTLMTWQDIKANNVTIDNFGVGANVPRELMLAKKYINAINVGDLPESTDDKERFLNIRAMAYWRLREWIKKGGEIVKDPQLIKELLYIRFRRNLKGKIQIMSKEEMRKEGYPSPNRADALMLTFIEEEDTVVGEEATTVHGQTAVQRQQSKQNLHDAI